MLLFLQTLEDVILEKPLDKQDAYNMLSRLATLLVNGWVQMWFSDLEYIVNSCVSGWWHLCKYLKWKWVPKTLLSGLNDNDKRNTDSCFSNFL